MRTLASRLSLVIATVGVVVAAGCGGADPATPGGSATTAPSTQTGAIDHATGPTDIVLRVNTGGGFVPIEFNLRSLPSYTLYGDGTVIRPVVSGADVAEPPSVTPLETIKLDEAGIQSLLAQAKSAGLLAPGTVDYGDMGSLGVSDMPTTSVLLNAGGATVSHDAYGLSFAPSEPPSGTLTQAQRDARAALRGFVALTEQQDPKATAYTPTRLAVWVAPALAQPTADSEPVVWPLATAPTVPGAPGAEGIDYRCSVIEGADVAPLLAAAQKAPAGAQWIAAADRNATFQVVVRALLPDEAGCPA
jgi:hypothetical protein